MTPEELHEQLHYLETWGKLYMYVAGLAWLAFLVAIAIWIVK